MPTNKPEHEPHKEDSPEFIGPRQPKTPPPEKLPVEPKPEEPEQDSHPEEV